MKQTLSDSYDRALLNKRKSFLVLDKNITYAYTIKRIQKLSRLFQELGIKSGDAISVLSDNDEEVSFIFLASLLNGITFSVLDHDIKEERFKAIVKSYRPVKIFIDAEKAKALHLSLSEYPMLYIEKKFTKIFTLFAKKDKDNSGYFGLLHKAKPVSPTFDVASKHKTALVLFTSGTTSRPKGVELSFSNIFSHLDTLQKVYKYSQEMQILNLMPLSHADGLLQGTLLSFYTNTTLHRPFKFKIQNMDILANLLKKRKITHFFAPPMVLSLMNKYIKNKESIFAYREFHTVVSVAAQLEGTLYLDFVNNFKTNIINVYGLTETVAGSLFTRYDDFLQAGTIGVPVDCSAKIIDLQGKEVCGDGSGELLLKGEHIMNGYFNDPLATSLVLNEGWFSTGDIASRKDEVYSIVGRKKNVVIYGGYTIYPEEITEVLNSHEAVLESAAFGEENEIWGESIISAVVLAEGKRSSENELKLYCQSRLEAYKIPRTIVILESLPRGQSGKVRMKELQQSIASKNNEDSTLFMKIQEVASECFMVSLDEVQRESSSQSIESWDSIGHLDFITSLENAFALKFKTVEILRIDTIQDVIDILESKT
ncbi:AMP-binding protein [bacterium]|nr:AMP-binding protein [bacterium]MBU1990792.1 AMP-binding protein [bacterium]